MKRVYLILFVLAVVVYAGSQYDASGGWLFNRHRRTLPNKPGQVVVPDEELIQINACVGNTCPLPPVSVSVQTVTPPTDRYNDLAARVASLERRLEQVANRQPQPQTIDYSTLAANLPPVKMEIHHPDGTIYTQSKPLGEPIRLRLVPQ